MKNFSEKKQKDGWNEKIKIIRKIQIKEILWLEINQNETLSQSLILRDALTRNNDIFIDESEQSELKLKMEI
jgi:hypothetical protein